METLYSDCVAAGVQVDHHESDLYIPANETTRALLVKHGARASIFTSQIDGKPWYDVPFAYQPFWDAKASNKRHFRVVSQSARKRGAIGVFYVIERTYLAHTAAEAESLFRHEIETNAPPMVSAIEEAAP